MPTGLARAAVVGTGVVTSVARDIESFSKALRDGACGIDQLRRTEGGAVPRGIGAEILDFDWRTCVGGVPGFDREFGGRAGKILNRAPESTRLSACAAVQALTQSRLLDSRPPTDRVGLIVAGSNIHQRFIHENGVRFLEEPEFINPSYALSFLDSSQVGCLSELFGIHGMGYTVGGASASGNVALYHAWQWIRHGVVDACVVVGASADFSGVERQGFSILGAACGEERRDQPKRACRPFDRDRSGFVLGEGSGCVVLENLDAALGRKAVVLGELLGGSLALDGNSLPNPSCAGELRAMRLAMEQAGVTPGQVDYINAHGSSSRLGDEVECEAILALFGLLAGRVPVNSTKSITGHCMFAAGIIEFIACLIQMNEGFVHPNLNLENPIEPGIKFAGAEAAPLDARIALSNGFGFGGINSSLVVASGQGRLDDPAAGR